ncbi:unnamed protein product, partial [Mycena citricolor]
MQDLATAALSHTPEFIIQKPQGCKCCVGRESIFILSGRVSGTFRWASPHLSFLFLSSIRASFFFPSHQNVRS